MKSTWFIFYSSRCKKHREMAQNARSAAVRETHRRLAAQYAEKAARAMDKLMHPIELAQYDVPAEERKG